MNNKYNWVVGVILVFNVMVYAEPQKEKSVFDTIPMISQMTALSPEDRMKCLRKFDPEWAGVQNKMIEQFNASSSKNMKCAIAYLMGLYRMEKCAGVLSSNITLDDDYILPNDSVNLWQQSPIIDALIGIGRPSIPEMIKNIEGNNDPRVRDLSSRVIQSIEGAEVGRFIIEKAIEKQGDVEKKKNLHETLKLKYFTVPIGVPQIPGSGKTNDLGNVVKP